MFILFLPYEPLPDLISFSESMDLITVYAIAAGGIFVTLLLMRVASSLISLTSIIYVMASKHLTYPYLLNRHQILGPWTRANVLLYLVYGAVNVFCIAF